MLIWGSVQRCIEAALEAAQQSATAAGSAKVNVVALGITNQRETTLVWSRSTGQPLHNAIVWLDNRTRCVIITSEETRAGTAMTVH
jgi:glycerol kinase